MSKKALIFMHDRLVGVGRMPSLLETHGFSCEIIFTPEEPIAHIDPLAADLLVVMGGPKGAMAVYEADNFPFLHTEIDFVKRRAAADKAAIGICLGAQIIAHALGGRVFQGTAGREIGWRDLHLTKDGENSPARHFGQGNKIMQWHGDTFDLPDGARLLASSDMYPNQIFSWNENIMALQCHPEVMKEQAARWIEKLDDKQASQGGETLEQARERLLNDTINHADDLGERTKRFMEDWLKNIGLA